MGEAPQNAVQGRHGHETSDVRLRPLVISGICLATLVAFSWLAMWLLFDYMAARQARLAVAPSPVVQARQAPPDPRLQVSPQQDLRAMLTAERATLHSYGWIDRHAGIVRIPIARAIDLLVERGLPSRQKGQRAKTQDPEVQR
jgi:hypothetical protein